MARQYVFYHRKPNGDSIAKGRADVLTAEAVADIVSELSGKVI